MKPHVLLTRRIPSSVLDTLRSACEVDPHDEGRAMPADELARRIVNKQGLVCVLTDRVTAELLDAAPGLKVVSNIAVGYENIDVDAARARGVVVTNTPDVLTSAVAEFTWGLILALARRIAEGDRVIRAGKWTGWALDYMLGTEMRGKQLGLVGRGRIGRAVAEKAQAFGMRVVFARHDMSVDELLVSSDVISIHVPATPANRHMIDRRTLARMKRSALFINTARGSIVDEEALAWALRERLIAGAALDVYEREPVVHPALLELENVLLVPHLGSATRETRTAMADLAVRNAIAVVEGRPALTPV